MRYLLLLLLCSIPAFSQSDFVLAERLFEQRQYQKAEPMFERYLKSHPSNLQTIEYLGDINGVAANWPQAVDYYRQLKTLQPSNANYHYKYGGALGMFAKNSSKFKALGLIADIRSEFETAIVLDPKHIEARWALIELYLQLPGIVGGSETKATSYANQLMAISAVDGHLAKGHIAEYFSRYEQAETHYKKAILIGGSKTTYQKLADLYKNKMNRPERAKAVLAEYTKKSASTNS